MALRVSLQDEYLIVLGGKKEVIHYYRDLKFIEANGDVNKPDASNTEFVVEKAGKTLRIHMSFEQARRVAQLIKDAK